MDNWNKKRKTLAKVYNKLLDPLLYQTPLVKGNVDHVYHLYVIRNSKRNEIREYLLKNNISSMIHYPIPVHKQKAYSNLGIKDNIPKTEEICNMILSLPLNQWLKPEEVGEICEILNNFGENND